MGKRPSLLCNTVLDSDLQHGELKLEKGVESCDGQNGKNPLKGKLNERDLFSSAQ